jgi:hypothetical protein
MQSKPELQHALRSGPTVPWSSHVQLTRTHNKRQMAENRRAVLPATINKFLPTATIIVGPFFPRLYAL